MINARDKMTTPKGLEQMNNNEEMCNLKKILGLEQGREYNTEEDVAKHLRYSKVMVMTDQDVDGSHIKGLFMNWIDAQWPSLMSRNFVTAMNTPIIKAKKGQRNVRSIPLVNIRRDKPLLKAKNQAGIPNITRDWVPVPPMKQGTLEI